MKRACSEPGCPGFASYRGRCPEHARQRDRSIHRAGRVIYNTKRWKLTRRAKLTQSPICERCEAQLATEVHHRTPIAEGGPEHAMDNLEALCKSCHSQATRREQVGEGSAA